MSKSRKRRTRKKRRQEKMTQRSGGKFRVNHKLISGRTGHVHAKKLKSRRPIKERDDDKEQEDDQQ